MWFGQEDALIAYAQDAAKLKTFVATGNDGLQGFVTVKQHFAQSFEIHWIAVHASRRGCGLGRRLLQRAAQWASVEGGAILLVKTLAPSQRCLR
jgi:GNAT superfamily N-acetyltransferase